MEVKADMNSTSTEPTCELAASSSLTPFQVTALWR